VQPPPKNANKCLDIKILTSKSYGLYILQTIFSESTPVKAFRRRQGEGVTPKGRDLPDRKTQKICFRGGLSEFFRPGHAIGAARSYFPSK
jgi:hypothetical protein